MNILASSLFLESLTNANLAYLYRKLGYSVQVSSKYSVWARDTVPGGRTCLDLSGTPFSLYRTKSTSILQMFSFTEKSTRYCRPIGWRLMPHCWRRTLGDCPGIQIFLSNNICCIRKWTNSHCQVYIFHFYCAAAISQLLYLLSEVIIVNGVLIPRI